MTALRDSLRDAPLPGEAEAAARSWLVLEAALAEQARRHRGHGAPRRLAWRLALVTALAGAGLAAALSPAGAWIGDRFAGNPDETAPAFAALPKGGSVLTLSRTGAYAVRADGSTQRLGSFSEAGWSPHGLHVVGTQGRRLVAVDPLGTPKWTLTRPRRVHHPAWSAGLGFEVAYLEGGALRAISGNGDPTTNRLLRRDVAAVTPAWRPRSDRVLTYASAGGSIETIDIETRRRLWSASVAARALEWTRAGHRLVALSGRRVTVLDEGGRVVRAIDLPGVARGFALHPSGRRAAAVVTGSGETRVLSVPLARSGAPALLFQGDVDGLAWSPDGARLLLSWRAADQWLLLGPGRRIRAMHGVSRELGARDGFPRVAGWCCGEG